MSMCEIAYISEDLGTTSKWIEIAPQDPNRIHPTQKPVKLYEWCLKMYAQKGWNILDTHLGSGSSRIAAHNMGFDFTGFEIDKAYFEAGEHRYQQHIKQQRLFV